MLAGFSALMHHPVSRVETKKANVLRIVIKTVPSKTENGNQFFYRIDTSESLCEQNNSALRALIEKRDRSRAVFLCPGSRLGRVRANPGRAHRSRPRLGTIRFRQFFQLSRARLFADVMRQQKPASQMFVASDRTIPQDERCSGQGTAE